MIKTETKNSKIYVLAIIVFAFLSWAKWFCWRENASKDIAALVIYNVLLIAILIFMIGNAQEKSYEGIVQKLVIMTAIVMFPMFEDGDSFGKMEMYLSLVFLLSFWCMLSSRSQWIVFPLGFIGILFQSSFAFRYLPFMLIAWYFCFVKEGKAADKITFYIAIIFDTVLFFYQEFFGDAAVNASKSALVIDKATKESNLQTAGAFVLILPLLFLAGLFIKEIYKNASKNLKSSIIVVAVVLIFQIIVKRDYGMIIFQMISGSLLAFGMMILKEKENIEESVSKVLLGLKDKIKLSQIIYIYVLMLMPIRVDSITNAVKWIVTIF